MSTMHSRIESSLKTVLGARRAPNQPYNVVGLGTFAGRYFLDGCVEDSFYKLLETAFLHNVKVSLAQVPRTTGVFRLDIDMYMDSNSYDISSTSTHGVNIDTNKLTSKRKHIEDGDGDEDDNKEDEEEDNDVEMATTSKPNKFNKNFFIEAEDDIHVKFVICLTNVLKEWLFGVSDEQLVCILLGKPLDIPTTKDKMIKRGFHVHYPYLTVGQKTHSQIIEKLIKTLEEPTIPCLRGLAGCIDRASYDVSWLFYGSSKPDELDDRGNVIKTKIPYKIVKCFDHMGLPINVSNVTSKIPVCDTFSGTIIPGDDVPLARKLSIWPSEANRSNAQFKIDLTHLVLPVTINYFEDKYEKCLQDLEALSEDDYLKYIKDLLKILDASRVENYKSWSLVGLVVCKLTSGSEDGKNLFLLWSSQSAKFSSASCELKWKSFMCSRGNYNIKILENMASHDNPTEFEKLRVVKFSADIEKYYDDPSKPEQALYIMNLSNILVDKVFCGRIVRSSKYWFIFEDHVWALQDDQEATLNSILLAEVPLIIKRVRSIYESLHSSADDKEMCKKMAYFDNKLTPNIHSPATILSIVFYLKALLIDQSFVDRLNVKRSSLVAFSNGVYDFGKHRFRSGRPQDYLTIAIDYPLNEYEPDCQEFKDIEFHLSCFFPDPEVRKYFLDVYCNVFVGGSGMKSIFVWVGKGNNGKTQMSLWLQKLLTSKFVLFLSTSVITGKKVKNGAANTDLAALFNKKLCFLDEPEKDEILKPGVIKLLTGNDPIQPREMYISTENSKSFIPDCIYTLICNHEPDVSDNTDEAFWDRLRVIPFEAKFSKENIAGSFEEQSKEKRFYQNSNIMDELTALCQPFARYLINHWNRNSGRKEVPMTKRILDLVKKYKSSKDDFIQFTLYFLEYDAFSTVSLVTFFNEYIKSLREKSIGNVSITLDDVRNKLVANKYKIQDDNIMEYKQRL